MTTTIAPETPNPAGGAQPACGASPDPAHLLRALAGRRDFVQRLLAGLIAAEMDRLPRRAPKPAEYLTWPEDMRIDEDGLGFDSLAQLELVAGLNTYFGLSRTGIEDYLLVEARFGGWIDLICAHLAKMADLPDPVITFSTSGSTGNPKQISHEVRSLTDEVSDLLALLAPQGRILSLVPAHHIYGFLFTILLPIASGTGALDLRSQGPGGVGRTGRADDLVIATPFQWDLLTRSGTKFASGLRGVTSTAPAPVDLWDSVASAGLEGLVEIFGSSETGGLGFRWTSSAPFTLFNRLDRQGETILASGQALPLQDSVRWTSERSFRPGCRQDGAVQVGGVNVFPALVRKRLASCPGVADIAIRPGPDRLRGFVVPAGSTDLHSVEERLRRFALEHLSAPERPGHYTFGTALPRSETGKLTDWS